MNKERYIRKILRGIKVTSQTKKRIKHDLRTELESKEEAGLTIDEVISQKGTPEKVADRFNQSYIGTDMYRQYYTQKSLIIVAIVFLAISVFTFFLTQDASIGIIGGADGPTKIFIPADGLGIFIGSIVGLIFFVLGGAYLIAYCINRKRHNRR